MSSFYWLSIEWNKKSGIEDLNSYIFAFVWQIVCVREQEREREREKCGNCREEK